jgi:two-component system phosphate regulon sensor histidine kinase PhoR
VAGLRRQLATIGSLAQGLVDLNRLESGRTLFRLAPETVASLIDEAMLPIRALLEERAIHVQLDVDPSLHVLADRAHAVRALRNVIDNARRHSPRDGLLEIGAQLNRAPSPSDRQAADEPEEIEIWIADRGPGIAPGDQARVFERFYRGDRSRSSTGSGLGLAIAKHVIEGHGGRIWVDESRREGACLRIRLLSALAADRRTAWPKRPPMADNDPTS